jgi:hypothetical protein
MIASARIPDPFCRWQARNRFVRCAHPRIVVLNIFSRTFSKSHKHGSFRRAEPRGRRKFRDLQERSRSPATRPPEIPVHPPMRLSRHPRGLPGLPRLPGADRWTARGSTPASRPVSRAPHPRGPLHVRESARPGAGDGPRFATEKSVGRLTQFHRISARAYQRRCGCGSPSMRGSSPPMCTNQRQQRASERI